MYRGLFDITTSNTTWFYNVLVQSLTLIQYLLLPKPYLPLNVIAFTLPRWELSNDRRKFTGIGQNYFFPQTIFSQKRIVVCGHIAQPYIHRHRFITPLALVQMGYYRRRKERCSFLDMTCEGCCIAILWWNI